MAMALDKQSADFEQRFAVLLAAKRELSADVDAAVQPPSSPTCARAATRR